MSHWNLCLSSPVIHCYSYYQDTSEPARPRDLSFSGLCCINLSWSAWSFVSCHVLFRFFLVLVGFSFFFWWLGWLFFFLLFTIFHLFIYDCNIMLHLMEIQPNLTAETLRSQDIRLWCTEVQQWEGKEQSTGWNWSLSTGHQWWIIKMQIRSWTKTVLGVKTKQTHIRCSEFRCNMEFQINEERTRFKSTSENT